MRRKDFASGQLTWITSTVDPWTSGMAQCKSGYPERVKLIPDTPATIIRRALAKDFGIFGRHTHRGVSTAAKLAKDSWLVLYDGHAVMIEDKYLNKRRYTPRKTVQKV
jgi:hypothetical protein